MIPRRQFSGAQAHRRSCGIRALARLSLAEVAEAPTNMTSVIAVAARAARALGVQVRGWVGERRVASEAAE